MTQVKHASRIASGLLMVLISVWTSLTFAAAQEAREFNFFEWSSAENTSLPDDLLQKLSDDPMAQLLLTGLDAGQTAYLLADGQLRSIRVTGESMMAQQSWSLPTDLTTASAAIHGGMIYVASAQPDLTLWALDVSDPAANWQRVADIPASIRTRPLLTSQAGKLYVTSGEAGVAWDAKAASWTELSASPMELTEWTSVPVGSAHILFFNRTQSQTLYIVYHVITDQWFFSELKRDATQVLATVGTSGLVLITPDGIAQASLVQPKNGLGVLDYTIVISLFTAVFLIGLRYARRSKSTQDYFRSSKAIPWWAAALSIFATSASAITVMAMPAMSFRGDWTYLTIAVYLLIIQVPLYTFIYVPIIRKLNFPSANQYLENRFGLSVRFLGFLGFSLNQILGRAAAILLLPAVAINAIFGIPIVYCILIMGLCTTIFVAMGGFEAVVWTDVLLALIMVSAIVSSLVFAFLGIEQSLEQAAAVVDRLDKIHMFDFRLDLAAPVVLVLFLNSLVTSLGYIGDQNFVQRVQSTKTQAGAKLAAVSQLAVAVPLNFVLFGLGTLLFLYYTAGPQVISPAMPPDGIFPFFAATALPPGMAGLVVIALLAATISTVSSALSSVSNVVVEDVYRRLNPKASDASSLRLGKLLTVLLGLFATGTALVLASLSGLQSIWDLFLTVTGLIVGPVTGTFVLGIFSRRTNAFGVWVGAAASVVANVMAKTYFDLHSTVFLTVGVFTCIVVGYMASLLAPPPRHDLTGLTLRKTKQ